MQEVKLTERVDLPFGIVGLDRCGEVIAGTETELGEEL